MLAITGIIFAFVTILIVQLMILSSIKLSHRRASLHELLGTLEAIQQQLKTHSSSSSDLKEKLKQVLDTLNDDLADLPDFVDIHIGNTHSAIQSLNNAIEARAGISSDILDFANSYCEKLQAIDFAISITTRELRKSKHLPLAYISDKVSRSESWLIRWLRESVVAALLTSAIILFSIYIALSMDYRNAITIGGVTIVVLGLIYEAQYLPRVTITGEFRAKTIGTGVPRNTKRRPAEFFVTHFGFLQVIIGTILSSIGADLIGWSVYLLEVFASEYSIRN